MSMTHIVVTLLAAATTGFSAVSVFMRAKWVVEPLAAYGIPSRWWPWLGAAKAAGTLGLVAGLLVPAVGVAAGIGLVVYFTGAVVTVARARWFSHLPFPMIYAVPVIASLVLGFTA
ncbi:DoxX family protein [Nonomuraea sp. SBT364]|uniref:DoxX family protein n=1 Tax=Nonomuraea sp. SBT364 TaxID=1580530 RepID=UPI00066CD66F|nr:DoxX family protein [Nonomuraea sp. SBT364]